MRTHHPGTWTRYAEVTECASMAQEAHRLIVELFPLCRSITGNGLRQSLARLSSAAPLELHEVASGTRLFDWEVPLEWNVRGASVRDSQGRTVVDFADNNLHLVGYSVPFRGRMTLDELQNHLHSIPEHPDWIPYRTSYYRESWGFCMRHRDREALREGTYDVLIDTSLEPGHLTYAEGLVGGRSSREVLIYAHACHPSLANDNLTGMVLAALVCRELAAGDQPGLSYRFVIGPGTLGSLAWLAANRDRLDRIEHGLVLALLGDPADLTYKCSRRGKAVIDRIAAYVLPRLAENARIIGFEPYGYDERQFCSPGFDLPLGRLTRSVNGGYPEYHTSADDPGLIDTAQLAEALAAIFRIVGVIEANRTCVNLIPHGEPRLGKRGLYGALGGFSPAESEMALLWVMNASDGTCDLLEISERSGLPFETIDRAAAALEAAGVLSPGGSDHLYERKKP